jgi:hypothetical protein
VFSPVLLTIESLHFLLCSKSGFADDLLDNWGPTDTFLINPFSAEI